MRVLVLNWKDPAHPAAGGAEVYTHQIARRWVEWGHDVTQFSGAVDGGAPVERDGVRFVRGGGRLTVYRAARQWYQRHGTGRFDAVVDEINTRPFLAPRFVRDRPVVALAHQVAREVWSHEVPAPLALVGRHVLEPWWLRAYRDVPVLTVSPSSAISLRDYGLRDVRVVSQGCDVDLRPSVDREVRPTLCFVGRMTASKRPLDAVEAFLLVRRRHPDAQLWMIGDGPLRTGIEALGVPGVRCWGRVSDAHKHELMARAHALIVTSVREGWGLVVDEAAALGTPTAAYDVAGLCDSVPAACGVLSAPTPQGLAASLLARLNIWTAAPAAHGWRGGAVDWDTVAKEVWRHVEAVR